MDMMAWNDLDIDIENETMSLDKMYKLTSFIMDTFHPVWYEAKEEINAEGKKVWFHGFETMITGELWNVDLWFFDRETIEEAERYLLGEEKMIQIRYVQAEDKEFWYSLDRHLPETEFEDKVRNKRGYVLLEENKPIGLLRYNLFWDNTPFCTLLFIEWNYHKKGYGKKLMEYWEKDMKSQGYGMLLTSTQVDEDAQHFYRKLGYKDCGGFVIDIPGYEQPMEMFMIKGV